MTDTTHHETRSSGAARHRARLATVATLLALVVAACAGTDDSASQPSAPGDPDRRVDNLRLAGGPWGYPSPFTYSRGPGLVHNLFLFDTLLWKDASGEPIPWLASRWEHSDDGLEWRFTLRDGVRWHDGLPLTADDVVFTFDYLTKGPGKDAAGIAGRIDVESVTAPGDGTVVFRLPKPFAPFEVTVAGRVPIIPRHVWEGVTDPVQFRGPPAVMGSGPYVLDSYDEATNSYSYDANPDYFLGPPTVQRLEFVPAPDELRALERGELHQATIGLDEKAIPDEALAPFDRDRYGRIEAPGELTRALHFNLTKGFPYDDKRFRQAIAYAVDRQDLVDRLLFGRGEPGNLGGMAPSHELLARDLPAYGHDPAKARALLDEVGLRDRNGDGFRDRPDGERFKAQLQADNVFSPKTAELLKEQLRGVGVDVEVQILDRPAADAAATRGAYEMALIGYGGLGGEPDFLRTRYASNFPGGGFTKAHGYANPRFDQLAAEQVRTVDKGERADIIEEMQEILAEDVPVISLYFPNRMTIFVEDVFDAWYYTPGGVFGGYPGPLNKHVFVTGKQTGFRSVP